MKLRIVDTLSDLKVAQKDVINRTQIKSSDPRLNIKCKTRCSGCCSRKISISVAEALIIHEYLLKTNQLHQVLKKCEDQAPLALDTDSITWFLMNTKCALLKDDMCSVYPVRPPVCAVHYSKSDPNACSPWSTSNAALDIYTDQDEINRWFKQLEIMTDRRTLGLILPLPNAMIVANAIAEREIDDLEKYMVSLGQLR